jgi:HAD superfamily hydrolase (TIGR01549 family)
VLQAVLFDAGLTLIRAATPAEAVAREALASLGITATPTELAGAMAVAQERLEQRWHRHDWWAAEATVRDLFVSAYRGGLASVQAIGADAALADQAAHAVYDVYQDTRHWALFADVQPTLQALRDAGVAMGIVSDWGHGLEAIILELELGGYLQGLVVSSRLGVSKPDPSVFQMALARLGARAEGTLYIGDTYVKDVLGARAAGLMPVLLDRAAAAPAMDCLVIHRLTDLLPLVGLGPAA